MFCLNREKRKVKKTKNKVVIKTYIIPILFEKLTTEQCSKCILHGKK